MNYMKTSTKRLLILVGVLLVCAACQSTLRLPKGAIGGDEVMENASASTTSEDSVAEFRPSLIDLVGDLSDLRATFNAYPDSPRLILLLSPT